MIARRPRATAGQGADLRGDARSPPTGSRSRGVNPFTLPGSEETPAGGTLPVRQPRAGVRGGLAL